LEGFPPKKIGKKYKVLKTKTGSIKENRGLSSSPQHSLHKNPNKYNGEVLSNQEVTPKNTHNKRVYIESYACY